MAKSIVAQAHKKHIPKKRLSRRTPMPEGRRFGRLTTIKEVEDKIWPSGGVCRQVECRCDCGTVRAFSIRDLKAGNIKSCGCISVENITAMNSIHGLSKHPLKHVWSHMKQRCYNPKRKSFKNYGGRGITVCDEWINDFKAFHNWAMAHGWEPGLLIDRKDVENGYSPDNCRFVDHALSNRNTRLLISTNTSGYRGVTLHKATGKWIAGIDYNNERLNLGYFDTPEEAACVRDAKAIELNAGHPLNFPEGESA